MGVEEEHGSRRKRFEIVFQGNVNPHKDDSDQKQYQLQGAKQNVLKFKEQPFPHKLRMHGQIVGDQIVGSPNDGNGLDDVVDPGNALDVYQLVQSIGQLKI